MRIRAATARTAPAPAHARPAARAVTSSRAASIPPAAVSPDGDSVGDDRQRLARAAPHRLLELLAQLRPGSLDQQVRAVVVPHHEHLGRDLLADRVALAELLVDANAHGAESA